MLLRRWSGSSYKCPAVDGEPIGESVGAAALRLFAVRLGAAAFGRLLLIGTNRLIAVRDRWIAGGPAFNPGTTIFIAFAVRISGACRRLVPSGTALVVELIFAHGAISRCHVGRNGAEIGQIGDVVSHHAESNRLVKANIDRALLGKTPARLADRP